MNISFSTLACPDWPLSRALDLAARERYDGIELRFVQGEDSLWKLPLFQGTALQNLVSRLAAENLVVSCVDTSCRFDSPDSSDRTHWIEEGTRMADLAAKLGAHGIRLFGDRIQPGQTREATLGWIVESLHTLQEKIAPTGVSLWLETHGDFASTADLIRILRECPGLGLVWDPAVAFVETGEAPVASATRLTPSIRHVHIKDLVQNSGEWLPVLTGEGQFQLSEVKAALREIGYDGFLSFEWEKKWHPTIANADIALPHFANWFRTHWSDLHTVLPKEASTEA